MYDPSQYAEGVPNPYTPAVHPYPSFQHGADYTRPVFGMPYVRQPFNVLAGVPALAAVDDGENDFDKVVMGALGRAVVYSVLATVAVAGVYYITRKK